MKLKVSFVNALVSGAVSGGVLAYSSAWLLLTVMQMLLLWQLSQSANRSRAPVFVFLYGLGFVLSANFWLGLAIYHPPVNSLVAACLLSGGVLLLHALSYMLISMALRLVVPACLISGTLGLGFGMAVVWTASEIVRSLGVWAMPWGLMGYAHLENPLLTGLYPVIGAHGVAGASWVLAALLLQVMTIFQQLETTAKVRFRRASMAACIIFGAALMPQIDWTQASGPALAVRLVHTDLPGQEKYTPAAQEFSLGQLRSVAAQRDADLSVFPELYVVQNPGDIAQAFRREVVAAVRSGQGALVFGTPSEFALPGAELSRYNTLVQIKPDGETRMYSKQILLPFSEYLPRSPALAWAYPYLYHYPQADLTPGDGQDRPFEVKGVRLGVTICSELAYAGKASRQASGAGLLVNASSDSWVPSRGYLAQAHLIARVRAAEAQKPMVRANNVGVSAFIDERGGVLSAATGGGTTGVMAMQPRSGTTPYVAFAARMASW